MNEVEYRVFTDEFTGQFVFQIISPAGAVIQGTAPKNTRAFYELTRLIEDFYRHLTEISIDINETV
jgi:hypothetical protein